MMGLTVLSGYDATMEVIGNLVGHIFYYLTVVVPLIPETQDIKVLDSPKFLIDLC
jgi:hypothetical protein